MAKQLDCNATTVQRAGQRMGLGRKPNPRVVAEGQRQRKRENAREGNSPLTFFDMVDAVFQQLVDERTALLERLAQLAKLPSDERGQVALEVASTNDRLNKVEASLIDAEELAEQCKRFRPKKPSTLVELTTMDELIDHLDTQEARAEEGHLAEKVRIAADRVTADWIQLHEYEDGTCDPILLAPETIEALNDEPT